MWCTFVAGTALWWTAPVAAQTASTTLPDSVRDAPLMTGSALQRTLRNGIAAAANQQAAEGGPAGVLGWQFSADGGVDLTYTDNVLLTHDDQKSDFIVTPRAMFAARDTTMRTAIVANAELDYDYYTNTHRLNGLRPTAGLTGVADVVEDELSVEGRLATDIQQISPDGALPATDRSIGENQVQVVNYGFRPTWREHLGDTVQSEVFYDYSAVHFLDPPVGTAVIPASDTQQHLAQASLSNGTDFTRFGWVVLGTYQELDPSGPITPANPRQRTWHGEGSGQYRLSDTFSIIARGGYDWFRGEVFIRDLQGPFGLGGFIWKPGPRLGLKVEVGYRYQGFNADAQFNYQAARSLNISLSYLRDVQNSQSALIANLANTGRDALGNPLIDPVTGLPQNLSGLSADDPNSPFNPNRGGIGFTNLAFKRDLFQGAIGGHFGRNYYSVSGQYELDSASLGDSHDASVQATLGRDLTPRLSASIQGQYEEVGGVAGVFSPINFASRTKSAEARADYRLGPTVTTTVRVVHAWRNTTLVSYTENAAVLSVIKRF